MEEQKTAELVDEGIKPQEQTQPEIVTDDIDMSVVNSVNFNLGDDLIVHYKPSDKKVIVKTEQDEEDIIEMTVEEFERFTEDANDILKYIKNNLC